MSDSRIAQLLRFLRMKRREGYKLLRSSEIRRFGDSGRSLLPSELACHCRIVGRRARFGLIGRWGYAYLVLDDSDIADGLFHQTQSGIALT